MTSDEVISRTLKELVPTAPENSVDHQMEYINWDTNPGGTQVTVKWEFLGPFYDLDQPAAEEQLREALQEWYDGELNLLAQRVVAAARILGELQVRGDTLELSRRREVPSGLGTFLGFHIQRTDGPERLLTTPEFGRFINLEITP